MGDTRRSTRSAVTITTSVVNAVPPPDVNPVAHLRFAVLVKTRASTPSPASESRTLAMRLEFMRPDARSRSGARVGTHMRQSRRFGRRQSEQYRSDGGTARANEYCS